MPVTSDEVHYDTTDAKPAAAVGNSKLDPLHEPQDVVDVESKARLILETNSFVSSEQILELFDKLPRRSLIEERMVVGHPSQRVPTPGSSRGFVLIVHGSHTSLASWGGWCNKLMPNMFSPPSPLWTRL